MQTRHACRSDVRPTWSYKAPCSRTQCQRAFVPVKRSPTCRAANTTIEQRTQLPLPAAIKLSAAVLSGVLILSSVSPMASATDFMATWQGRAADLVAMSGATVTAVEHPVTTNGMSTTRKRFSITAETVLSCANCKLQVDKVVCPAVVFRHADGQRQKLDAAEENFKNSDTLKMLLERSEANRAKNKKAIQNK